MTSHFPQPNQMNIQIQGSEFRGYERKDLQGLRLQSHRLKQKVQMRAKRKADRLVELKDWYLDKR